MRRRASPTVYVHSTEYVFVSETLEPKLALVRSCLPLVGPFPHVWVYIVHIIPRPTGDIDPPSNMPHGRRLGLTREGGGFKCILQGPGAWTSLCRPSRP